MTAQTKTEIAKRILTASEFPNNASAEEALLGAMLTFGDEYSELFSESGLKPDEFYVVRNGYVWKAMLSLRSNGTAIDSITVAEELRRLGLYDECGGKDGSADNFLFRLVYQAPLQAIPSAYTKLIRAAAWRRRIIIDLGEVVNAALNVEVRDQDLSQKVTETLVDLAPPETIRAVLRGHETKLYYAQMEAGRGENYRLYKVPSRRMQLQIPSLPAGTFGVISAYSGVGKTAFCETWAEYEAEEQDYQVFYGHTELTREVMLTRRMARHSRVAFDRLILPIKEQTPEERKAQTDAQVVIDLWKNRIDFWYIDGAMGDDVLIRFEQEIKNGAQVLILDYFQEVINVKDIDQTNNFIRRSRRLAEKYGVMILYASQLRDDLTGKPEIYGAKYLNMKSTIHLQILREVLKQQIAIAGKTYEAGAMSPETTIRFVKSSNTSTRPVPMFYDGPCYSFTDIQTFDEVIEQRMNNKPTDNLPLDLGVPF